MIKSITKLLAKMERMETKFEKLGVSSKEVKAKEDTWTCMHCKAEKCFASRATCYKCGEPKVPTPPGLGVKAAAGQPAAKQEPVVAVPMVEEETLEERISELEENLRFLKGKETVMAKATKFGLEAQLKELKEQQRQARPLPARLQAATDRVTKT